MANKILAYAEGEPKITGDVTGISDTNKSDFDPNNVESDAFDRTNHVNSIKIKDIYGLGPVATLSVGTDVAAGDHTHAPIADMKKAVFDPTSKEEEAYDQGNHNGQVDISMVSGSASLNIGTGSNDVAAGNHGHAEYIPKSQFDPDTKQVDVFKRTGHKGTQEYTTISGLGDSVAKGVGSEASDIAKGKHTHPYFTHKDHHNANIVGSIFDRSNHYGLIGWDVISDAAFTSTTKGIVPKPQEPNTWLIGNTQWTKILESDTYADPTTPGAVKTVAKLGGNIPSFYLDRDNFSGTQSFSTISDLDFVEVDDRNEQNGHIGLDEFGKLPYDNIPTTSGTLHFAGTWDALNNTPPLPDVSAENSYYVVTVAGDTDVNGHIGWVPGDWVMVDSYGWTQVKNKNAVSSVNEKSDQHIVLSLSDFLGSTPENGHVLTMGATSWDSAPQPDPLGVGDMYTTTYDHWATGTVQDADKLNNQLPSYYLAAANHTGKVNVSKLSGWGPVATASFGTGEDDIAKGNHTHVGFMPASEDLSSLLHKKTARENLGLTDIAIASFGLSSEQVAEGSHTHLAADMFSTINVFPISLEHEQDVEDIKTVYPTLYGIPNRTVLADAENRTAPLHFHSYSEKVIDHGFVASLTLSSTSEYASVHKATAYASFSVVFDLEDGSSISLYLNKNDKNIEFPGVFWANNQGDSKKKTGTILYTFVKIGTEIFGSYVR